MNSDSVTDGKPKIYLDHAGATLPTQALLENVFNELRQSQIGNPHSSSKTKTVIDNARNEILEYFRTTKDEYSIIFTSGTTAAIKMVGELFPWSDNSCLCYPMNAHTSLLGLRCYAKNILCFPSRIFQDEYITSMKNMNESTSSAKKLTSTPTYHLMTSVGECNFSGAKSLSHDQSFINYCIHQSDTEWISAIPEAVRVKPECIPSPESVGRDGILNDRQQQDDRHTNDGEGDQWLWLLDAAKLVSTSPLDLSKSSDFRPRPHFVVMSFYKMFGYPTGLGALLVRNDVAHVLRKCYYGGGTIQAASADANFLVPHPTYPLHSWLEDGTPHFQGITALKHGFAEERARGGIQAVQLRTHSLAFAFAREIQGLSHCTGRKLCTVFGRHDDEGSMQDRVSKQGAVVTFVLWWSNGTPIGSDFVGRLAARSGITIRTGCFCCIGGCQEALQLTSKDIRVNLMLGRKCGVHDDTYDMGNCNTCSSTDDDDDGELGSTDIMNGKHTGAVRVSLGWTSTTEDCDAFIQFLKEKFLNKEGLGSRRIHSDIQRLAPLHSLSFAVPATNSLETAKLLAVVLYPIKSCAGVRVKRWPLSPNGLLLDRQWAVIGHESTCSVGTQTLQALDRPTAKEPSYRVLTLRTAPRLALVRPELQLTAGVMVLTAPNMDDLSVPIQLADDVFVDNEVPLLKVMACGHGMNKVIAACQVSVVADDWFSRFMGRPCKLVRLMRKKAKDEAAMRWTGESFSNSSVASNNAQLLAVSLEKLHAFQQFLSTNGDDARSRVGLDNFRPNLVLQGVGQGGSRHDSWLRIHILVSGQSIPLNVEASSPCERCGAVNVNPNSGERDRDNGGVLGALAEMVLASDNNASTLLSPINFGVLCKFGKETQGLLERGSPQPLWIAEDSDVVNCDS